MEKGTIISHYTILEKLGEGGMGVVYKARDTKLDRDVALKFLPQQLTASEEDRLRFIREAKSAAALNHPNICTIHSVDEYEGNQFIVMEYIDGNTLGELQKSGTLEPGQIIDYAIQIAEALSKAHDAGIIHRDIKPGNIMVNADGRIKMMDFGLAKLKGSAGEITKTGSTVGTMAYMAPEQIQGREVDHRADIFAFGVVLFEMLTGTRPFRGEHEAALTYSIVNEEPAPFTKYVPHADPELVRIVEQMLEKNLRDRYQSAESVITDLRRLVQTSPQEADTHTPASEDRWVEPAVDKSPDSDSMTITIPGMKTRRGIAMVLTAVLLVVGTVYFAFFSSGEADAPILNEERVLVAPFENRTGDASLDPLGRTAADWITEGIAQTELVETVPTSTILHLIETVEQVGGGVDDSSQLRQLAEETAAGIVISGSFIQLGDDIQLQARIIDVQTDNVIQAIDPVRGSQSEPMEVVEELRREILGALSVHVFPDWNLRHFGDPPVYEAHVAFMEGMEYYGLDYEKAFERFNRAVEIDPDFIRPKIFMAIGHGNLGQDAEAHSIVQAIEQERDQLSPYDRYVLDWIVYNFEGRREEALATLLQLEEIAPRDAFVNFQIGSDAVRLNRPRQTIETYSKMNVSELEHWAESITMSWWFSNLAWAHHLLGEYTMQLDVARQAREYFPKDLNRWADEVAALAALGEFDELREVIDRSRSIEPMDGTTGQVMFRAATELRAHGYRQESLEMAEEATEWYREREQEDASRFVTTLMYAEQWEEAYALLENLMTDAPDNVGYLGAKGVAAALTGDEDKARRIEEELAAIDRDYLFGRHTYQRARVMAALGEKEKAVILIEKAFERGKQILPSIYSVVAIHNDLAFEPLHDYPPFQEILEQEGRS